MEEDYKIKYKTLKYKWKLEERKTASMKSEITKVLDKELGSDPTKRDAIKKAIATLFQ